MWEYSESDTVNDYKETVLSGHSRSNVHMYYHSDCDSMWKPVQVLPWRKVSSLPTWGATGNFYLPVEGKSTFSMIVAPSKSRKLKWKHTYWGILSRHKLVLAIFQGQKNGWIENMGQRKWVWEEMHEESHMIKTLYKILKELKQYFKRIIMINEK